MGPYDRWVEKLMQEYRNGHEMSNVILRRAGFTRFLSLSATEDKIDKKSDKWNCRDEYPECLLSQGTEIPLGCIEDGPASQDKKEQRQSYKKSYRSQCYPFKSLEIFKMAFT